MQFSILVNAPPQSSASAAALDFCRALCDSNNTLHRIFFVSHGVLNAHSESTLCMHWQSLIEENQLDACCCVNSCIHHQLANSSGLAQTTMNKAFAIAGLGLLVEASVNSERLITFGARSDS
ncbi:MAG: DsrE family protein [Agarilytica sp.]